MTPSQHIRNQLKIHKKELFEKYPIKKLSLFGSYSRSDFTKNSDVDILVEFERSVGIEFIDLANELEHILGKKVDLVSRKGIKNHYYEVIKQDLIDV